MTTEYRVEKQHSTKKSWHLAYEDAAGYLSEADADARLESLRDFMFRPGTRLRVASREVSDWVPVPTELDRAIARLRQVMVSDGQLGYQDADVRLLIQAVEQGA